MCDISTDIIDQESFDCSDSSSLHVTYRARLSDTPETDSLVLISHIEKWVSGGPNVRVQGVLMRIDHDCQVSIESFNDDLCTDMSITTTDSDSPTTASPSSQGSSDSTVAIIGGVVAVVLIIAVAIVIVIISILALVWKSCHGQLSIRKTEE